MPKSVTNKGKTSPPAAKAPTDTAPSSAEREMDIEILLEPTEAQTHESENEQELADPLEVPKKSGKDGAPLGNP